MKINLIVFSVILFLNSYTFSQQNIWEPVGNPLTGKAFTAFAIDCNNILYVGTFNGFYKSSNNGDSWVSVSNGLNGLEVSSIVFNDSGDIFVGTYDGGGIFKSTAEGESWVHLEDSLVNFSIRFLGINSVGYLFAAISGKGIYRSTNNGASWLEVNNGLTNLIINSMYLSKYGVTENFIFIGTGALGEPRAVFRSIDNGESWYSAGVPLGDEFAMTFVSNSQDEIYVGKASQWHHTYSTILKSVNGGTQWNSTGFVGNTSVLATDINEFIYAGSLDNGWGCFGIRRSTDNGNSWQSFNSGLPPDCTNYIICNNNGILFTPINFEGVYRTIESTTNVNENEVVSPKTFILLQNYPNPFNPSTTIKYQLPHSGKVTLKVYDLLGEEIRTLVNEEKAAGNYEVNFDASALKSGVYFYTLQAYNFRDTKKMILIK